MDDQEAALRAYYALDLERDRLAAGAGRLEFARTVDIVSRTLPDPPATVADVGGGPGRYTGWLVDAGYTVVHRDLIPRHVEEVRAAHGSSVDTAVGDARSLDLADSSFDVVLCLGPLYHLPDPSDRARALREATRIVRPGGVVHVAAISRWAIRLDALIVKRAHEQHPVALELIDEVERSGQLPPIVPSSFTGYVHRPEELRDEVAAAGLELDSLVNVEGIGSSLGDIDARMEDADERTFLLDMLRAVESVPELLGVGPHLLATARRPQPDEESRG